MDNSEPLISIITVSYNSAETIKDTIQSILNQTYSNIEYIIIDGQSKDDTVAIVKSYESKFLEKGIIYKWISEQDAGIYDAMNKGLAMANGEIIGIINSDDWYEIDTVETIINLNTDKVPSIFSGAMNRVTHEKKVYKTLFNQDASNVHNVMPVNHPATFVSKEVYKQLGGFDTKYKLSADYDFIFRAFNAKIPFKNTDKVLVNMRNTGATGQLKNLWLSAREDYDVQKKNNVKRAFFNYIKKSGFNCLVAIRDTCVKPILNG